MKKQTIILAAIHTKFEDSIEVKCSVCGGTCYIGEKAISGKDLRIEATPAHVKKLQKLSKVCLTCANEIYEQVNELSSIVDKVLKNKILKNPEKISKV